MASSSLDFPPLPSSPGLGSPSAPYAANVSAPAFKPASFPVSFFSPTLKLSFNANDLIEGKSLWNTALIGYSLGPRPYYERLLKAMQKLWPLKGSMSLLSLADRIASYIGIPISVDSLTASRTRLTFTRVCVLISKDSVLHDEIPIEIDGEDMNLKVLYDWKLDRCEGGRSSSRACTSRPHRSISKAPSPQTRAVVVTPINTPLISPPPESVSNSLEQPPPPKNSTIPNLNSPTEETSSFEQMALPQSLIGSKLPLVNKFASLQMEDCLPTNFVDSISENETSSSKATKDPPDIRNQSNIPPHTRSHVSNGKSPNKLKPPKGKSAKKAKAFLYFRSKISTSSVEDLWFCRSHLLFENEGSCNNFRDSSPGRLWIKWDSSAVSFNSICSTSQIIHGILSIGSFPPIYISVIYASNSIDERKDLWNILADNIRPQDQPWIILGDFNCYIFESEKAGGTSPHSSQLGELNNMIFNCGVQDLSSTGLFYTWFNQRVVDPIHIKLDRVLVNVAFLDFLPSAYYKVEPPLGSDHSPLILVPTNAKPISTRFMFKNFWTNMDGFWDDVHNAFSSRTIRSPLASFYHSLHSLKRALKNRVWASSSYLSNSIHEIKCMQNQCLLELQSQPLNLELNNNLKCINENLASLQANWTSWITQRAKALWLTHGEEDVGFLFAKIRSRNNRNIIKEITSGDGHFSDFNDISKAVVNHFEMLYNPIAPPLILSLDLPTGNLVPSHFQSMLVAPISFEEVKSAIFDGKVTSTPGPDGFSYAFYRRTWHILGTQVFDAVNSFFTSGSLPKGVKATAITLIPKCSHASNINDFRPISLCNVFYKIIAKILAERIKKVLPLIIHESQSGFIANKCSTDNIILASKILRDFKGSQKGFCAKLDIKKAFDSVSREFLIARLLQKGFPEIFVSWIKSCISEVYFSVCLNGSLEGFFKSSSGLRQGWISCKGININHLMYADDLLVFGEASHANAVCLSSRVQFLKFTIANTIAYWIRGSIIPKSCCATINKLCSRFLFHTNILERKLHLIAWSKVTLPKQYGGLGLPSIEALYHGVFCSIIGRFYNSQNLLTHWYKAKFVSPWKPTSPGASNFWKKICATATLIKDNISFSVSLDSEFSFLWDSWLNGDIIGNHFNIAAGDDFTVKELFSKGNWDLPSFFPNSLTDAILNSAIKENSGILWNGSPSWAFKFFIEQFHAHLPKVDRSVSIWHKKHALKYACFAWMAVLGKLKTADNLLIRGIEVPQLCSLCNSFAENHNHLFFACDFSFNILKFILPYVNCFLLRPTLAQVLEFFINSNCFTCLEKDFCCLSVSCILYHLWRERNSRRFSDLRTNSVRLICNITTAIRFKISRWKNKDNLLQRFTAWQTNFLGVLVLAPLLFQTWEDNFGDCGWFFSSVQSCSILKNMMLISWVYGFDDFRLDGCHWWRQFYNLTMMTGPDPYFRAMDGCSGNLARLLCAFVLAGGSATAIVFDGQPEQPPSSGCFQTESL
ncbi:hypothetical protein KFK09_009600 [Dendrobium nobile]|uniref:Uncharacterized protein n=1 Tax=Dendrobium nobile TaxID=94219 RepID=A0A8T3BKE9_DENNO|nr:hypothetical protein KFK09_009600 [Dendrobium nobile]